jgi:hypothetical protein
MDRWRLGSSNLSTCVVISHRFYHGCQYPCQHSKYGSYTDCGSSPLTCKRNSFFNLYFLQSLKHIAHDVRVIYQYTTGAIRGVGTAYYRAPEFITRWFCFLFVYGFLGVFFVSFIFYGKGWIHIAQSLFFPLSFGHCIGCPSIYDLFVFFNIS